MRLKYLEIRGYKNLKDFQISFDQDCFIDIFVGKNGCGKSNLFEALMLIFNHLIDFGKTDNALDFSYHIIYELRENKHKYIWDGAELKYNDINRKTVTKSTLPDNILVYYSGHNDTVSYIIEEYQEHFSKRIKKADIDESRKFLGIDSGYKSILLGVLLLQPDTSKAKKYVCQKLGIPSQEININLRLKRPAFADKSLVVDRFEETTFYWGTKGITLDFLTKIMSCIKGSFNHAELYDFDKDAYNITINGKLYRDIFKNTPVTEQFRFFDNLNTLEMLDEMSAAFSLSDNSNATIYQFSDGQFQSIYIYSILEFFKDRKCLLLLDEPDSFLHPEWQHAFLKQVLDIAEEKQQKNHILMSSHSASTIAPVDTSLLSLVVIEKSKVKQGKVSKTEVIRSLSGGVISFSEEEARLTITQMIDNTEEPILFTEGVSDVNILNIAYEKLYPSERRPFLIHDAFDRGFLRTLFARNDIFQFYPEKEFFALFDFDDAYKDWKCLGSEYVVSDVEKGLCLKLENKNAHCFVLPIPDNELKKQVWDDKHPVDKVIPKPCFCIEHIFWSYVDTQKWFKKDKTEKIVFKGDKYKIKFSENIVPTLDRICFEPFRPMFELIKAKC